MKMDDKIRKILGKLGKELDEDRFQHTMGVMYTSAAMAMRFDADQEQALLAGLLHDCAKCIPGEKKIQLCEKQHLGVSEVERKNASLRRAKRGAAPVRGGGSSGRRAGFTCRSGRAPSSHRACTGSPGHRSRCPQWRRGRRPRRWPPRRG